MIIKSTDEVDSLRFKNQSFSISFIVAGITLTLITTSLEAVESQNADVKKWRKLAIVGLGAAAVAAQSLNAAFPVTKKAAEYVDIEWNLKLLENKLNTVTTENEFKELSARRGLHGDRTKGACVRVLVSGQRVTHGWA
jgi:hypothetical protein